MKQPTNTNHLIHTKLVLAMAMAMASWLPTAATAADAPMKPMKGGEHKMMPGEARTGQPVDGEMMMQRCQAMKKQKEKMMADMKAQDTELTAQVAKMNGAPEDKKLDLTAAVVTQMVEQRSAMNARKARMQDEMMKHMTQHMQMGKESMAQCPMMNGMKDMDKKPADGHNAHQTKQE